MSQADRHAKNVQTLRDLEVMRTAHQGNGWEKRLASYAEKGYPSGGSTGSRGSEINRPTERLAISPDDMPAQRYKRLKELEQQLSSLAREYRSIYLWTTETVAHSAQAIECGNSECPGVISNVGFDVARQGRCTRCAQHWRRYKLEWPSKPVAE